MVVGIGWSSKIVSFNSTLFLLIEIEVKLFLSYFKHVTAFGRSQMMILVTTVFLCYEHLMKAVITDVKLTSLRNDGDLGHCDSSLTI